jgi:LysM repeat protein
MKILRFTACAFILLSCVFLSGTFETIQAKDETAHIEFRKTATSLSKKRPYVVKKGEWLFEILRTQVGITSGRHTIIKALNPHIKDVDKIEPGDTIYLPDITPHSMRSTDYTIKKGDSITRIAIRQLHVAPHELRRTVNEIKRLNPYIKNYDLIYPGHALRLPRRGIVLTTQEKKATEAESSPHIKDELKETQVMVPETRLAIIGHVINRMKGTLITAGKYYIPIPKEGQVTVDCSTIPVAELDDGSTIFLDISDQIPDSLKNIIRASWKNYNFVKVNNLDGTAAIIKKIADSSREYTMAKSTKPLVIGETPRTTFALDWLITKKSTPDKSYSQGLSFITDISELLPRQLIAYAEKRGTMITEILDSQGVMSAPDEKFALPQLSDLPSRTNVELADALLNLVGYRAVKDSEFTVFETGKEGFNLSMKIDLRVKKGDTHIILHSKRIPQHYIDNLRKRGTEVVIFEDGEPLKSVIGKVLQSINIPFSYDNFIFSFPEKKDSPKALISFPAFKIARDKGHIYLTEFDIDRDIYSLLHNKRDLTIVKY